MAAAHLHPRAAVPQCLYRRELRDPILLHARESPRLMSNRKSRVSIWRIDAASGGGVGDSYLDMWKKAVERERKSVDFGKMAVENEGKEVSSEELERMNREFGKLLEVPVEERDRVQRMQVIDRAAAAIAAARALLKENSRPPDEVSGGEGQQEDTQNSVSYPASQSTTGTPGPSFWAWAPPRLTDNDRSSIETEIKRARQPSPSSPQSIPVLEHERSLDILPIPFETSMLDSKNGPPLPPLQSFVEVEKTKLTDSTHETTHTIEENEIGIRFSAHAVEAAGALSRVKGDLIEGVNPNGSRWWSETGVERRSDGVLCKWTLMRGVSADEAVEWENKYWEAADEFGYKELGSEKSGRDATGNVWRECWRESMMEKEGVIHFEKTADKWGKNIQGDEWQEKWWEHYDATGQAEKWAHKWCSIDPHTPLEVGHAHVWHERWGEKFDGQGGSVKYTDKWAERFEGDGWAKWGDKWDEHFGADGCGLKQGETWWEGKYGDRWNRTWGEGHNGSGWVHKYGKSSSGEHWDTHIQQDTWYERFPHFGFFHCFENSVHLRDVKKPSEWS
ncbi:Unknown protein [Striga hermonthica]|uniref:Uncharacterized protein n=1 Tax=Striga hermonthica TaxID=68872 RepID=A0A9N7ND77_STRHE|nr:Unknown protein [Striga hermonthica]